MNKIKEEVLFWTIAIIGIAIISFTGVMIMHLIAGSIRPC